MTKTTSITSGSNITRRIDGVERSYGVVLSYGPEAKEMQYIMRVAYVASIQDDYHCKLHRAQVFINGVESKRLVDVLAARCMQCIYPIELRVSLNKGIVAVLNFSKLKARWQEALKDFKKEYDSPFATQYFEQIDTSLANETVFLESLKNDLFYNLFFFSKEAFYTKIAGIKQFKYKLPVTPYQGLTTFTGHTEVSFKSPYINFKHTSYTAKKDRLELNHRIHDNDYTIQNITGRYSTNNEDREIRFKIIELQERETGYVEQTEAPEAIPKQMIKKKKINLSHLFGLKK